MLSGGPIIVFRLLPALTGLGPQERSLASLRPMVIKTIQLHRQLRRAERYGHIDLMR